MSVVLTAVLVWLVGSFALAAWLVLLCFLEDWRERRACRALGREVDRMARGR